MTGRTYLELRVLELAVREDALAERLRCCADARAEQALVARSALARSRFEDRADELMMCSGVAEDMATDWFRLAEDIESFETSDMNDSEMFESIWERVRDARAEGLL